MKRLMVAALLLAACGDDAGPQGTGGSGGGGSDLQYQGGELPTLPPAGKKRTVEQRNPFGNVADARNLLWDGDFEWTSPFTDQYGWWEIAGISANPVLSDVVLGAACKSGVKCARVKKRADIIGLGVGSSQEPLVVSAWVKFEPAAGVEAAPCSDAEVTLVDIGEVSASDPDAAIALESETPDENGWCHFSGMAAARQTKPYLFVSNNSLQMPMLVDDVVMTAVSERRVAPLPAPAGVELPAERRAHLARVKAAVRAMPRLHEGRADHARQKFEEHMQHQQGAR